MSVHQVGTEFGVTNVTCVALLSGGCTSTALSFCPPDRFLYMAYMPDPVDTSELAFFAESFELGDLLRKPRRIIFPVVMSRPKPS
jgi:hypothetical protein